MSQGTPLRDDGILAVFARAMWEVACQKADGLGLDTQVADLGIESVALLEVIGYLEDELGVHFPEARLREVRTVGDLADIVADERRSGGAL